MSSLQVASRGEGGPKGAAAGANHPTRGGDQGLHGTGRGQAKGGRPHHQELEGVRTLWQKNLVPITRFTSLERDAARLDGERSQLSRAVAQAKGKIAEIQLQVIQIDQDLRTEVEKDLIETRSKLAELAERKTAAVDQLNRTDIRAPQVAAFTN